MKVFSKKLTAVILAIVMMVSMMSISALANPSGLHFTVGNTAGEPGDTVFIDITMSGNPGFVDATLQFDVGTGLTVVGYSFAGSVMPAPLFNVANARMSAMAPNPAVNFTGNGHVVTLEIDIGSTASSGPISVDVRPVAHPNRVWTAASTEVLYTSTAGAITVDAPFVGTPATVRVEPSADAFFDENAITAESENTGITVVIDEAPAAAGFNTTGFFNADNAVFASITLEDGGGTISPPFGFRTDVTMPIPPGVNPAALRVFHYGTNPASTPTATTPRISGGNFTFTMPGNQLFAFGAIIGADEDTGSGEGVVQARVIGLDEDPGVYGVEIEWGDMLFVFDHGNHTSVLSTNVTVHGTVNTINLTERTQNTPHWRPEFINGANNRIGVTNISGNGIPLDVNFNFMMEPGSTGIMGSSQFNADATDPDRVVGGFYNTNAAALTAAGVLTTPTAIPTSASPNLAYGASDNVFFAFSGTPDGAPGDGSWANFRVVGRVVVSWEPAL